MKEGREYYVLIPLKLTPEEQERGMRTVINRMSRSRLNEFLDQVEATTSREPEKRAG